MLKTKAVPGQRMDNEAMTICLVSQEYPPETGGGGIGVQTFLKAHGLANQGHTVHVISSTYTGSECTYSDGKVKVHRIPHPEAENVFSEPTVHWVNYSWLIAKKIYKLSEKVPFDFIEFPEYGAEGFIYQIEGSSRIPIVVMLHGSLAMFADRTGWPHTESIFYRYGTFMEEMVVHKADLLLAASHNIARFWVEKYAIPSRNIEVVHTTVDSTLFPPPPARVNNQPTILFVGRIDDEKGICEVTEAVLRLRDKYPTILFKIIGTGDEDTVNLLHQKIDANGARQNVEFVGHVPYTELAPYYAGCDVFASPAPNEHGLASVYLEAMSCAKPVVASTTGGAPEAVIDGQTGLLVPPRDIEALIRALDKLLADPELRARLGRSGREKVLNYFSLDKYIARVEEIYKRLLANSSRMGGRELAF